MARLMRPLRQLPLLQQHCCSPPATLNHLLSFALLPTVAAAKTALHSLSFAVVPSSHRSIHHRSRALKSSNAPPIQSDIQEGSSSDSDSDAKKSRNQKKREARRAVRWGMELASFSPTQIKRILRVASLGEEVLDALILVKRLGPDVREGKRRQFNYIGKLLREVESELMDTLIRATKDGDMSTLKALAGSESRLNEDVDEESEETEIEEEEEEAHGYINIASRWFDGLINKDIKITNEVYSLQSVDFDRQELRKLVRRVHTSQECQPIIEGNEGEVDAAIMGAKKSLNRFLHTLAKRMPNK